MHTTIQIIYVFKIIKINYYYHLCYIELLPGQLWSHWNDNVCFFSSHCPSRKPVPSPSPRIMSPMGFAIHRQARHLATVMDDNSYYDDEWDERSGDIPPSSVVRPVPIWLCVFLVISYIIAGAFLFSSWEKWSFLDSAYFCFITLTTIGNQL